MNVNILLFVFAVVYLLVFHVSFGMFSWTYWKSIFTPAASPCKKVSSKSHAIVDLQMYYFNFILIWCVCFSSFSSLTQTSKGTRWRRGRMHRNKSWLRLPRSYPSTLELSLEVNFHLYFNEMLYLTGRWISNNSQSSGMLEVFQKQMVLATQCKVQTFISADGWAGS